MVSSSQSSTISSAVRQLRWFLVTFALCLLIPLSFLGYQGYQQLRLEMYFPYRWSAEQVLGSLSDALSLRLQVEQARAVPEYSFYTVARNPLSNTVGVVLSPLSMNDVGPMMKGFRGYFQVNAQGDVTSPLLPFTDVARLTAMDIDLAWSEIDERLKRLRDITDILAQSGLNHPNVITNSIMMNEDAIDQKLWLLDPERTADSEETAVPGLAAFSEMNLKVGPFRTIHTTDGLFIFYRAIQGDLQQLQGFVMEADTLLDMLIRDAMMAANFESKVTLRVVQGDQVVSSHLYRMLADGKREVLAVSPRTGGEMMLPLYSGPLAHPLANLRMEFYTGELPFGPVSMFMGSLLIAVLAIVVVGLCFIYWFGLQQIRLAEDRLNFVSAVSHELRTPLTSIRMYAEMLREKMVADEDKRDEYYDFIFFESERLSRLISNVLQLSKLGRQDVPLNLEKVNSSELISMIESKVTTLANKQGFELSFASSNECELVVDQDAFSQIAINLIDNAIKFAGSANESEKKIDVSFSTADDKVLFAVRDYGPGIPASQEKKIFQLFYRSGSELTRTAPGTGIGLALVSELASSMGGSVELVQRNPGVEFRVSFLRHQSS